MKTFVVNNKDAGKRADVFLNEKYDNYSRSSLKGLFKDSAVRVDGKSIDAAFKLDPSMNFEVDESTLFANTIHIELPIVFEDNNVIVIDKPAGILTHSKGAINKEPSVASFIKPKLSGFPESNNRAGVVHRLDRHTSGIIIAAKNPTALTNLQNQFTKRSVTKIYQAIVSGIPNDEEALIDIPIARSKKKPNRFTANSRGKKAITRCKIVKTFRKNEKNYSLLELAPLTGRTHQLRVHLLEIGHPIVGDIFYKGFPAGRLYLHASNLQLHLPSGEKKSFRSLLPKDFSEFIDE